MISLLRKSQTSLTVAVALVGLIVFLPACSHRKVVQLGSHRVIVSRHGFEKKFHVEESASVPTFEYAGISTEGKGLKVSMQGDQIKVNGVDGRLKSGDSVLISDDGVAVNSLDYGESAKYLQANNLTTETAVRY